MKATHEKILKVDHIFPKQPVISNCAKDLISKLLVKSPEKRIKLEDITIHEFLTKNLIPQTLPKSVLYQPPSKDFIMEYDPEYHPDKTKKVQSIQIKHKIEQTKNPDLLIS